MTLPLQSPLALMARNISSQERNPPASPPWALSSLATLPSAAWEHPQHPHEQKSPLHSVHPGVAPRRGRRQGTALPYHFQSWQWHLPVQKAGARCVLPFVPTVEQLDAFTHNLHFRAATLTFSSTPLTPCQGPKHSPVCPHLQQHPNMSFYSVRLVWQAASPACVSQAPSTLLPAPTPEVHTPACQHETSAHRMGDITQVQNRLFLIQPPLTDVISSRISQQLYWHSSWGREPQPGTSTEQLEVQGTSSLQRPRAGASEVAKGHVLSFSSLKYRTLFFLINQKLNLHISACFYWVLLQVSNSLELK